MFIRLTDSNTKKPMLIRSQIILRVEEIEDIAFVMDGGLKTEILTTATVIYLQDGSECPVQESLAAIDAMLLDAD